LQFCRDFDLGEKASDAEYGAQFRFEDFEGDEAVMPYVSREIDGGHTADSDLTVNRVPAAESVGKLRENVHAVIVPPSRNGG